MNEATYWRQRYEMLMANFGDALKAAGLPPPPTILADKESYEAGRIAGMAQRKPLTDEEIYKIANDLFYGNGPCDTLAMCRAIEAAHGIKENA